MMARTFKGEENLTMNGGQIMAGDEMISKQAFWVFAVLFAISA
jgi:hypothetical protein